MVNMIILIFRDQITVIIIIGSMYLHTYRHINILYIYTLIKDKGIERLIVFLDES